ncbi:MAG: metallophosphoesterase [Polaromonas sp.]|uniref:metallophosphoesterase family protein n=1 Tax=Polaromonas sp. TaxID=1869339 RepID=UPI002488A621|nr:metallophosphoesterase [Polaromonas sp.]MDI1239012.1 metallophosphoesterase [Polaromonas sp.]MDI1340814.1 metallophosphoesterase [Polaromonas sp.]
MKTLLQISDPHFGTAQPLVMEALVALARQQRPDVLVLSGDITQRATATQFREARAFCERLQIPQMLALPGNHDIPLFNPWQRLVTPYARYLQAFGPELEPVLDTAWLQLSTVKTTRRWRHKNGEVSGRQIERVSARLRQSAPGQLRVVVVHQPVMVLRAEDEHDRLRGWEAAVRAWAAAGADIVMGGHIHLPYVCELSSCVNDLPRRLWCVQAGTALSSRIRREAPNSVNLLLCDPAHQPFQGRLERWDFRGAGAAGRFELAHTSELMPDRAGVR